MRVFYRSVSVAALVVLVTFVLCEVTARFAVFLHVIQRRTTADPEIGWRLIPNLSETKKDHLTFDLYSDDHGFRIGARDLRHVSQCDAMLLGDCFAFGEGVNAEDSVAGILRSNYPRLSICNTGVQDYGTDQQLLTFKRAVSKTATLGLDTAAGTHSSGETLASNARN